ncbi:hypothetical protein OAK75_02855 [Bacteriovoracales bacterium]|nr:hypothetical protein [Bacteriovoracales bacterium]
MKKLSCLILILLAFNVSAEKITYNQWLDNEIESFSTQDKVFEQDLNSSWSLKKVKLRIRPLIGVEVPYLASLEIKPFVEFHWKAKK